MPYPRDINLKSAEVSRKQLLGSVFDRLDLKTFINNYLLNLTFLCTTIPLHVANSILH